MTKKYEGAVVFGSDGVHYPVGKDEAPDLKRPLRATEGGGWRFADDDEPLHNDVHHLADLELTPGSED